MTKESWFPGQARDDIKENAKAHRNPAHPSVIPHNHPVTPHLMRGPVKVTFGNHNAIRSGLFWWIPGQARDDNHEARDDNHEARDDNREAQDDELVERLSLWRNNQWGNFNHRINVSAIIDIIETEAK